MHRHGIPILSLALLLATGESAATQEMERCPSADILAETARFPRGEICRLLTRAVATNTDALYVLEDGRTVLSYGSGRAVKRVHLMSVTKSVAALAVGRMLLDGSLDSLGVRVSDIYPEWRQGRKEGITIRHLLTHTSGIQDVPSAGVEIEPAPDAVQLALAAELSADPGVEFDYNNKAVNLLAGIVERLTGQRLDAYLGSTVFADLGIEEYDWIDDPAGNPYVMAGLSLSAADLAKLGQLLLNEGIWEGRPVIDAEFARAATRPQKSDLYPTHGYLWWLVPEWRRYFIDAELLAEWREAGVDDRLIGAGEALLDRRLDPAEFRGALERELGSEGYDLWLSGTVRSGVSGRRMSVGPIVGFNGNGWLGQWIVAYPDAKVVAVRLIDRRSWEEEEDNFADFIELMGELVQRDR